MMSAIADLTPVTEFDPAQVSSEVRELLADPVITQHLLDRNAQGVLNRHGRGARNSVANVREIQSQHRSHKMATFVVREIGRTDLIGMATVFPGLPLLRQKVGGVPPFLARRLGLSVPVASTEPSANIFGWAFDPAEQDELGNPLFAPKTVDITKDCYSQLIEKAVEMSFVEDRTGVWGIEPANAPATIHAGIELAGMTAVGSDRYDVYETRFTPPPISRLYVARNDADH